jgi:hypothetical protein
MKKARSLKCKMVRIGELIEEIKEIGDGLPYLGSEGVCITDLFTAYEKMDWNTAGSVINELEDIYEEYAWKNMHIMDKTDRIRQVFENFPFEGKVSTQFILDDLHDTLTIELNINKIDWSMQVIFDDNTAILRTVDDGGAKSSFIGYYILIEEIKSLLKQTQNDKN